MKRLSLIAGILLLGTLASCGGGGSVSVGGGGGDVGGSGGSGATIPIDTGDDSGDGGELAPTGGGGGSPVAVEIPALGDVNNLPFISGEVVTPVSSSISAAKSFKSLMPQAAISPPDGGIILSGAEQVDVNDSMTACATAQQWQNIWRKNAQTNDYSLCKTQATVQHAEDNGIDPYDGNYHILTTEDANSKIRFRVVRGNDNTIERYESFTCGPDANVVRQNGDPITYVQNGYSLYTISGQSITISTKYYNHSIGFGSPPQLADDGNVAVLTGTLYEADPTKYTAKTLSNVQAIDSWWPDGGGGYYLKTADSTVSSLTQEPSRVLINSGTYSYRQAEATTTTNGLYSSATISNPAEDEPFNPAHYRMYQGAGILTDPDLVMAYFGYSYGSYILPMDPLIECWDNSLISIECLDGSTNYQAINGHTPRDASDTRTEGFVTSESWDCSGSADIPEKDSLYLECDQTMASSFATTIQCKNQLSGYAVTSGIQQSNGSGYPPTDVPAMTLSLSHGADGGAFEFTNNYIPDPLSEYFNCLETDCSLTSIGFKTVEGPKFALDIVTQPTGKLCQITGGNGLYYGYGDDQNDLSSGGTYIKCTDCPGGICPSAVSSEGKVPTKMVMFSSDYGIDGFIGFGAANVRERTDKICRYSSKLPDGCGTPHAFISVSGSDDLSQMPSNFGFSDTIPIVSPNDTEISPNWARVRGAGLLTNTLEDAGVSTGPWWSGSDFSGALHSNSCSQWTTRKTSGRVGSSTTTTPQTWISNTDSTCDRALFEDYKLLCLCPRLPYTVFVTAVTWSPSGGVSGADTFCNNNKPEGVSGTYKALLANGSSRVACTTANCGGASGTSENVGWVLRPYTQYRRADGTVIGTTSDKGVFAFPLSNAFDSVSNLAWTGIDSDWTTYSNKCNGWTTSSDAYFGLVGNVNAVNIDGVGMDKALAFSVSQCNSSRYLTCVEQP